MGMTDQKQEEQSKQPEQQPPANSEPLIDAELDKVTGGYIGETEKNIGR
jgi:hypothetical protein